MNAIIDFLNSHASVRKFTDQPITEEQERVIVTTAQRSPTSSNLQAYSIITVRNPDKKATLARLCGDQSHVAESALFLVFCADLYRLSRLNERRGYRFHGEYAEMFVVATVDTALAAARALMAAQALGFGGVMVGGIRNQPQEVSKLIGLPELTYPVMGMSLGKPAKTAKLKPRLPIEGICFEENYRQEQLDDAVARYDRTIDEVGYLHGREITPERYPDFEGVYSWSEHSARRLADDAPRVLRPHMKEFLLGRGFLLK